MARSLLPHAPSVAPFEHNSVQLLTDVCHPIMMVPTTPFHGMVVKTVWMPTHVTCSGNEPSKGKSPRGVAMNGMQTSAARLGALGLLLGLVGCGPATFTRTTVVWEPFDARENRQQRDNVTVELKFADQLPPSFFATVARCDQLGRIVVDKDGRTMPEQVSLGTNDQVWQQISVTNDTQNVLRLNSVVVRLFDPAGTQYNVLSKADLQVELISRRPCNSTQQALGIFASNPIFDRNIEIVPGTTSTFWVSFKPATRTMVGIWKIALYDVPVSLDPAGRPLRTTRFETRIAVRQVNETYRRDSLMAKPQLLERTEVTPTGTQGAPAESKPPSLSPAPTAPDPPSRPAPSATTAPAPTAVKEANANTVVRAQARLNALGYQVGSADGVAGTRTRHAIRQFQQSKGLLATGELDAATLSALGIN